MIERSSQLDDDRLANLRYARKVDPHDFCNLLHRELLAIVEREDELLSLRELSNGLRPDAPSFHLRGTGRTDRDRSSSARIQSHPEIRSDRPMMPRFGRQVGGGDLRRPFVKAVRFDRDT